MAESEQTEDSKFHLNDKKLDRDKMDPKYVESGGEENLIKTEENQIVCEHSDLLGKTTERDLSNFKTVTTLFKAMTGPSMLGMPVVIRNGGLVLGTIGFLAIGIVNLYCNITVVNCCRMMGQRTGKNSLTYEDLMEYCFMLHSDKRFFLKMEPVIRKLTVLMLLMCQLGLLSVYIKIIGSILDQQLQLIFTGYNLPTEVTELFVCLCLIPYSWMRNFQLLSWFSGLANILIVVCAATVLQYVCQHLQSPTSLPLVTQNPWTLPLFFGSSIFTVEGIPMILPIENKVKNPGAFGGCCGLMAVATAFNITLNLTVGFFGYLALGDGVPGNVLIALPDEWIYRIIQCVFALVVFLTFPLQLYLPAEVFGSWFKHRFEAGWCNVYSHFVARTIAIIGIYLFAALVPKIELLMSFVGSFCSVTLVFVFPPMAEFLIMLKEPGGVPWYIYIKCSLFILIGIVACVTGTYISVQDMVR